MESTIRADRESTTLINLFNVEPNNQDELVELLKDCTNTVISKSRGWISTNLLKSKDRQRVVVYSQWRSSNDIASFRQNPDMAPFIQRVAALSKFEAMECDVCSVLHV